MNDTPESISFSPPLPCCTVKGEGNCGAPATTGTLYPTGSGIYILQPFCRDCVAALQKVYGPPGELFPPPGEIGPRLRIIGREKRGEPE